MIKALILTCCRGTGLSTLVGLSLCLLSPLVVAQSLTEADTTKTVVKQDLTKAVRVEQRNQATYDTYILGPGDGLEIELLDLPELSGQFSIGPDGTLYLPRLRSLYVEGLTVEELRHSLTQQFSTYVLDPQVYVRPVVYRAIRIYVGGEVKRPGYYTLRGARFTTRSTRQFNYPTKSTASPRLLTESIENNSTASIQTTSNLFSSYPTVFDAIRSAQGITPYSDLASVQVTRKRGQSSGGGRIRTNLNFLSLIIEGDESQNIRLFDGDVVNVGKSNEVMREQLLKTSQTNLSPQFVKVFVSGRVNNPGAISVPQGSSLNQAVAVAGGARLIKGKVEYVHFTQDGETERRLFNYNPRAAAGAANNPLLSAGDLIRITDSFLSATTTVLNEITAPAVGIYSLFSLFEKF